MFNGNQIQRPVVKIILATLIILEIFLIATRYSFSFDDYITLVIILLAFPLAFCTYHYLTTVCKEAADTQRFSRQAYRRGEFTTSEVTNKELEKLTESPAYREYQKSKKRGEAESQSDTEEQKKNREELEQFVKELEQKEVQIFSI